MKKEEEREIGKNDKKPTHDYAKQLLGYDQKKFTPLAQVEYSEVIRIFFVGTIFSFYYIYQDNKKRIFLFLIGMSTIILVVGIMALLQNFIRKAGLIFLKISEDTSGEADVYILPTFTNTSQFSLLNFTEINEVLQENEYITGCAPRWMLTGKIMNREDKTKSADMTILVSDTDMEEEMGLGRAWPYRTLGELEIHAKTDLLWTVGARPQKGDKVIVSLDADSLLSGMAGDSTAAEFGVDQGTTIPTLDPTNTQVNVTEQIENLEQVLPIFGIEMNDSITVLPEQFITDEYSYMYTDDYTVQDYIDALIANSTTTANITTTTTDLTMEAEFTVVDGIVSTYGKYPNLFGNIAVIDSKYLEKMFDEFMENNVLLSTLMALTGINLGEMNWYENAFMIVCQYRDRFTTYIKKDDAKTDELLKFSTSIAETLGYERPVSIQLPTASGMTMTDMISMFLDVLFLAVVVILSSLGIILIFALLLANVEEKTYEFGMLRALGLSNTALVQMTLNQGIAFAIPGIIVAFALAFVLNIGLDCGFLIFVQTPALDITFSWDAIVFPISLGLIIPFVASFIPIRKALGKTLRNSLDVTRKAANETKAKFIKLESYGLELWQTTIAIMMIVFGFVIYYVMPLSFIFNQMSIFMYTMEIVFIGMLAGLCLLAVLFEPFLERIILEIFLLINFVFPRDRRAKNLIVKNLATHRSRSRRTFLMFTLSVAFLITSGVNFSQLVELIQGNLKLLVGSHLIYTASSIKYDLQTDNVVSFLEEQQKVGNITDYAFTSHFLDDYPWINRVRCSNMAIYPSDSCQLAGVAQNYLDATFNEFFIVTETNPGVSLNTKFVEGNIFKPNLIDSLYTNQGKALVSGLKDNYSPELLYSGRKVGVSEESFAELDPTEGYVESYDVIASEAFRDYYGITSESPILLSVRLDNYRTEKFISKPHGLISKCPSFFFSSYQFGAISSAILTSVPLMDKILQDTSDKFGSSNPQYQYDGKVKMRMLNIFFPNNNEDDAHRYQFKNKLAILMDGNGASAIDLTDLFVATNGAVIGFNISSYISGAIAMIFCTYMLALSFISNVRDTSWEFGVLRATGFNAWMLIRCYVYEAMVLVIAAFFLGTIVGVIIGSSLISQFNLFLEMPFKFAFPYEFVFSLFGIAVFCAIVGSLLPALRIKNKEIALVLRGLM